MHNIPFQIERQQKCKFAWIPNNPTRPYQSVRLSNCWTRGRIPVLSFLEDQWLCIVCVQNIFIVSRLPNQLEILPYSRYVANQSLQNIFGPHRTFGPVCSMNAPDQTKFCRTEKLNVKVKQAKMPNQGDLTAFFNTSDRSRLILETVLAVLSLFI